jgi:hypothetical protein
MEGFLFTTIFINMKIRLTESELIGVVKKIINEQYDVDRLYPKDFIVKVLKSGPKELKHIIKKLPSIPCSNEKGEETTCTKIPEVVQVYLTGRY